MDDGSRCKVLCQVSRSRDPFHSAVSFHDINPV